MKKILVVFICILAIFTLNMNKTKVKSDSMQKDVASKLIRFHVIANSDSKGDQALKLKVRDKVLEYIQPKLKNSKSVEESRKILSQNNEQIITISKEVIKQNGYNYNVNAKLSNENFPMKTYGNITLPQGKYEAYRLVIGRGEGQNWWCVMFPPLCFVDITKGQVSYEKTEQDMRKVLSPEEYKIVDNGLGNSNSKNEIKVQFKILNSLKNPVR